jgi:hypothetical protein
MSIIPPVVLTATQLVGGLVASAKNARDLAKDTSNHELKAAISDLYDEENRHLKEQLARRDDIEGPFEPFGYFFTKQKPDNPLCPACLQSQPSNAVFLGSLRKYKGGQLRKCPVCGYGNYEEPPTTGPAIVIGEALNSRLRGYV